MTKFKSGWTIATGLVTLSLLGTDALAQRGVWVQLGCQSVGFTTDRDVIRVGRREGRFKAIRLIASGNRVHMLNLRVVYANGEPDNLPVNAELRPGVATAPLDLRGRERAIDRVEMVYRSELNFKGRARVCVDALD